LSPWLPLLAVAQLVFVYLLLPPFLLVGYVVNGPPYFLLKAASRFGAKLDKDAATIKLFGALVLYPLVWLGVAVAVAIGQLNLHAAFPAIPSAPVSAAVVTLVLCMFGGVLALRYVELSRQTMRAIRVRFTRRLYRRTLSALRTERAALHDVIEAMAAGLALPGRLEPDGRVRAADLGATSS